MSLGNWGQNFLRDAAGTFFGSEYLRDFRHASKTFRTNSYQNAPKLKFLFHTYFETNIEVFPNNFNYGLLVKTINLPNFKFDTETLNQYNRKRIVQSKIRYNPIEITFHDDNNDSVNALWNRYYKYYYNDGMKPQKVLPAFRGTSLGETLGNINGIEPSLEYNNRNIYNPDISDDMDWGYSGGTTNGQVFPGEGPASRTKLPFFKNITVFGFNQHNFTAYTLINPVITDFRHDTYDYSSGNGIMESRMTIDYEAVVYNYGALDGRKPGEIVAGFGDDAFYDRTVSPIARPGANGTILGQGGLVDGVGGTLRAVEEGNILGAVQNAGRTLRTATSRNLKTVATQELNALLRNTIQNTPNSRPRNLPFSFPRGASSPGPVGASNFPVIGARLSPPTIANLPTSGASTPTAGTQNNASGPVEPSPIKISSTANDTSRFDLGLGNPNIDLGLGGFD